jgi:hypothetical protein
MDELRSLFLTTSAAVALGIGCLAFASPETLLESKGVLLPNAAAALWMREVGVLIFGLGATLFLLRKHADSATLRAVLFGNAIVHLGLLPLELGAYDADVITRLSGIVPNTALHIVLASGFVLFGARMRSSVLGR